MILDGQPEHSVYVTAIHRIARIIEAWKEAHEVHGWAAVDGAALCAIVQILDGKDSDDGPLIVERAAQITKRAKEVFAQSEPPRLLTSEEVDKMIERAKAANVDKIL